MARNPMQFQKRISLNEFLSLYGTEQSVDRTSLGGRLHRQSERRRRELSRHRRIERHRVAEIQLLNPCGGASRTQDGQPRVPVRRRFSPGTKAAGQR